MTIFNIGNNPTLVVGAGSGPALLYNRDVANQILWGQDSGIIGGNSNEVSILDPQASIAVGGTQDLWAITAAPGVTVALDVMEGVDYLSPSPALIAEAIVDSGLPIFTSSTVVASESIALQAENTTESFGPFAINQIGYEIQAQASTPNGTDIVSVGVELTWSDGGVVIEQEVFTWMAGSASQPHIVYGRGPTKGNSLTISVITPIFNGPTVNTNFTFLENSRTYLQSKWKTYNIGNPAGFSIGGVPMSTNVLTTTAPTVAKGGAQAMRLLALYTGTIQFMAFTSSLTSDANVELSNQTALTNLASNVIYASNTNGQGVINSGPIELGRDEYLITMTNNNAASSEIISVLVVAVEQAVC